MSRWGKPTKNKRRLTEASIKYRLDEKWTDMFGGSGSTGPKEIPDLRTKDLSRKENKHKAFQDVMLAMGASEPLQEPLRMYFDAYQDDQGSEALKIITSWAEVVNSGGMPPDEEMQQFVQQWRSEYKTTPEMSKKDQINYEHRAQGRMDDDEWSRMHFKDVLVDPAKLPDYRATNKTQPTHGSHTIPKRKRWDKEQERAEAEFGQMESKQKGNNKMTKYTSDKGMQKLFEGFNRFLNEETTDPNVQHWLKQGKIFGIAGASAASIKEGDFIELRMSMVQGQPMYRYVKFDPVSMKEWKSSRKGRYPCQITVDCMSGENLGGYDPNTPKGKFYSGGGSKDVYAEVQYISGEGFVLTLEEASAIGAGEWHKELISQEPQPQ